MKIHIIGGGGSGKSFIARRLVDRFKLPALDLDEIFWDREAVRPETPAVPETRDAALRAFVQQDGWIVEGVYYRWVGPSFERADTIIVMTPPLWLRQVRLIYRYFRRKLGLECGSKESLARFLRFLAWNRHYDADNLARALKMLEAQKQPVTKCKSLTDVLRHLEKQLGCPMESSRADAEPKGNLSSPHNSA